ncbi:MAG: YdcF family protein [Lachnospiraceae bacterium]|nr:YdcF family protein [Lachnospiraceae bacterium]
MEEKKLFYDAITDFIFVENQPRRSDIIFVPGSACPELALHAASLYREGFAPRILLSGKYSITKGFFERPDSGEAVGGKECREKSLSAGLRPDFAEYTTECDYLCAILLAAGVPEEAILREREATFTWENAIFSRRRTDEAELVIRRAILCCKTFHARRSLMYYQQQFPETEFLVCPAAVDDIRRENWHMTRHGIDTVLGEVERCGGQFHEIIAEASGLQSIEGRENISENISELLRQAGEW